MENYIVNKLPSISKPRFGEIAIEYGLITPEQVKKALKQQFEDKLANRHNRLIGFIFFDNGWITLQEIEMVFNELVRRNKEYKKKTKLNDCYEKKQFI